MEVGEFKEIKIRDSLKVKQLMGLDIGDYVYALFKNNCIKLRTKQQYDVLLGMLERKIETSIEFSDKEKYKKYRTYVMDYSKTLAFNENHSIYFGVDVFNRYNFRDGAIVVKCSDCLRLWNPSIFRIKQDDSAVKRGRR